MVHLSSKHTLLIDYELLQNTREFDQKELSHLEKRIEYASEQTKLEGRTQRIRERQENLFRNKDSANYEEKRKELKQDIEQLYIDSNNQVAIQESNPNIIKRSFTPAAYEYFTPGKEVQFERHQQLLDYTS